MRSQPRRKRAGKGPKRPVNLRPGGRANLTSMFRENPWQAIERTVRRTRLPEATAKSGAKSPEPEKQSGLIFRRIEYPEHIKTDPARLEAAKALLEMFQRKERVSLGRIQISYDPKTKKEAIMVAEPERKELGVEQSHSYAVLVASIRRISTPAYPFEQLMLDALKNADHRTKEVLGAYGMSNGFLERLIEKRANTHGPNPAQWWH